MTNEEHIERIIRGTAPDARRSLLRLLVDVETAAANFTSVCRTPHICRDVISVHSLVALRHAIAFSLVQEAIPHEVTNQPSNPGGTPRPQPAD